eukprot:TRINITY_DN3284_c0_g1_i1.p1 TRINITY_DN3284_c0_g1~~TRINITY_DN3284_c0_g1_i1.p1  ORF type:complete len:347 (-),score=27.95 TRINITY_DN3284_c0_g1_i1:377-1417(-)
MCDKLAEEFTNKQLNIVRCFDEDDFHLIRFSDQPRRYYQRHIREFTPSEHVLPLNLVFVGSSRYKKALIELCEQQDPEITVDEQPVHLVLHEATSTESRVQSFEFADVIVFTYTIKDPNSLNDIKRYREEMLEFYETQSDRFMIPSILVGLKGHSNPTQNKRKLDGLFTSFEIESYLFNLLPQLITQPHGDINSITRRTTPSYDRRINPSSILPKTRQRKARIQSQKERTIQKENRRTQAQTKKHHARIRLNRHHHRIIHLTIEPTQHNKCTLLNHKKQHTTHKQPTQSLNTSNHNTQYSLQISRTSPHKHRHPLIRQSQSHRSPITWILLMRTVLDLMRFVVLCF